MQQSPTMMPVMPSFSSNNITTEQIQKYLDENKKLILAILENQNLGKLAECSQYQAQLQKNLMYLAAIADAQPQTPAMPTGAQMPAPHPAMQQGAYFMHPQAAAAMAQQSPGIFPPKMPMPFASPHQLSEQQHQHLQQQQHQHQQAIQGQMNMRSGVAGNGMHQMQSEPSLGGGPGGMPGQNKQDPTEAGPGGDVHGSSGGGRSGNGGDGSDKGN